MVDSNARPPGSESMESMPRDALSASCLPRSRGTKIRWTVKLANTKAAWYTFQIALDIPEANMATPATLRNAGVADRRRLAITPSEHDGRRDERRPKLFDDGSFMGSPVYLGEIMTDEKGRLVVLGGRGESRSSDGSKAITFANNEGWHDDVSDGPVTAQVTLDGVRLTSSQPGWSWRPQLWPPARVGANDVGPDAQRGDHCRHAEAPVRPSYTFDILPIFERLADSSGSMLALPPGLAGKA